MSNDRILENLYRQYLQSQLNHQVAIELCQALSASGLTHEAQALKSYLKNGPEAICTFQEGLWKNRKCFTGSDKPVQAEPGDLWLDTTELTLAVLVPSRPDRSPDTAGWVSTHPVYVWQFRTFLSLVEIGKNIDIFPHAADCLMPDRFESMRSMDFVVNLYHDEALAYAGWFDKGLTDDFTLEAARDFLNTVEFLAVLPAGMKLWSHGEYSEWLRVAVGANNIDKNPHEDELKFEEFNEDLELLEALPDRILFKEWDKRAYIGLSTDKRLISQFVEKPGIFRTLHFEILNSAPRFQGAGAV
jgi:hypothetical protein